MNPIQKSIVFGQKKLSYYEFGASKTEQLPQIPEIYWLHANGFGAGCYAPLHTRLAQKGHTVRALDFLGHGDSEVDLDFKDWNAFRDQVIQFVADCQHGAGSVQNRTASGPPCLLVGHSLGGASALMAAGVLEAQGYAVRGVVLLDPTVLSPLISFYLSLITNPMAPRARARRRDFKSMQLVRRSFRMQPTFKHWHAACFDAYLETSFKASSQGYTLKLDPEMEARIFERFQRGQWRQHRRYSGPIYIQRPRSDSVCPPRSARSLTRRNRQSYYENVAGSHFFPFEYPYQTSARILDFIAKISGHAQ